MRGLLLKELYTVRLLLAGYLLLALLFSGTSAFFSSPSFFSLSYPVLLISMLPLSSMESDIRTGWSFAAGLPCTRTQLISAKFLLALLLLPAAAVPQLLLLPRGSAFLLETLAILSAYLLFATGVSLAAACIFPGERAGHLLFLLPLMGFFALMPVMDGGAAISAGWLLSAAAAVFALSWCASIAVYQRRDL